MRPALRPLALLAVLIAPTAVTAAGYNRVHLVPALKRCPGVATCPLEFESSYTFDSIVLRSPSSKYSPRGKPSLILEIRGVRDASGAAVNGNLTLRLGPVRVHVPGVGTFPDDSPFTESPPVAIPVRNGTNAKFAYRPAAAPDGPPSGTIANGGGVEILDPEGKSLAVTGSQTKP